MADLDPLIRLRRHTVEEKQKILAALLREAENLAEKKIALEDQVQREKELAIAQNSPEASADFGRYAENARKKIARFQEAIRKVETRIDAAQEEVRMAFAELKKVQIVQRTRREEERREDARKEANALDDIAIEGFRRKDKE